MKAPLSNGDARRLNYLAARAAVGLPLFSPGDLEPATKEMPALNVSGPKRSRSAAAPRKQPDSSAIALVQDPTPPSDNPPQPPLTKLSAAEKTYARKREAFNTLKANVLALMDQLPIMEAALDDELAELVAARKSAPTARQSQRGRDS